MAKPSLREIRQRIDQVFMKVAPVKINKDTIRPWTLIDARQHKKTYQLAYYVPAGYSPEKAVEAIPEISSIVGAAVEVEDRTGAVIIHVLPDDFPEAIPITKGLLSGAAGRKVLLGIDRMNEKVWHDFGANAHLLIGSMPGYGKTAVTRLILYQLARNFKPSEIDIYLIDFKQYSYLKFLRMPHVKAVGVNLVQAANLIEYVYREVSRRNEEVLEAGSRETLSKYRWMVLLIDELAQIAPKLVPEAERKLARHVDATLAKTIILGRESGLSAVLSTQSPDSETVNAQIRRAMTAALGFRCITPEASKIVIKHPGLEKLDRAGRGIYATHQTRHLLVPHIKVGITKEQEDPEWEAVLKPYYSAQGGSKIGLIGKQDGSQAEDPPASRRAARDEHRTNRKTRLQGPQIGEQTDIGDAAGASGGPTYREQAPGNWSFFDPSTLPVRPRVDGILDDDDDETDTLDEPLE